MKSYILKCLVCLTLLCLVISEISAFAPPPGIIGMPLPTRRLDDSRRYKSRSKLDDSRRYRSSSSESSESIDLPETLLPGTNIKFPLDQINMMNGRSIINDILSLIAPVSSNSSSEESGSNSSSKESMNLVDQLNTFIDDLQYMQPNKKIKKKHDHIKKICSDKIYKYLTCKNFTTIWPSKKNSLTTPKMYYFQLNATIAQNFFDAAHWCLINGMNLVTIEDAKENDLLKRILYRKLGITTTSAANPNNAVLIGLGRKPTDSQRYWLATGQSPSFTDWSSGEPNNVVGSTECTYFYQPTNYEFKWVSGTCISRRALFICEAPDECAVAIGKKMKKKKENNSSGSSGATRNNEVLDDNNAAEVTDDSTE